MSEKFSLKWNDYQSNWKRSMSELRNESEFSDVTLISEEKVKLDLAFNNVKPKDWYFVLY